MGSSWAKVSVVAIALAALGGCCDELHNDKLGCNLQPTSGVILTVKGTAQYSTKVAGDAVVEDVTYFNGENTEYVQLPKQPFSVTVELEVGDLFQSLTDGYVVDPGSISSHHTFSPADGSPETENEQVCWNGVLQ
jgi:hypothetical protein